MIINVGDRIKLRHASNIRKATITKIVQHGSGEVVIHYTLGCWLNKIECEAFVKDFIDRIEDARSGNNIEKEYQTLDISSIGGR